MQRQKNLQSADKTISQIPVCSQAELYSCPWMLLHATLNQIPFFCVSQSEWVSVFCYLQPKGSGKIKKMGQWQKDTSILHITGLTITAKSHQHQIKKKKSQTIKYSFFFLTLAQKILKDPFAPFKCNHLQASAFQLNFLQWWICSMSTLSNRKPQ